MSGGMTREEAFRLAMRACEETWNEKTCKQIRESLEQEPHEDIKAEIQATIDEEKTGKGNINKGVVIGLQMALYTIDKYKAEIEPQESEKQA